MDGLISKKVADPAHFAEDKNVVQYLRTGTKEGLLKNDAPAKNFAGQAINITVVDSAQAPETS